MSHKDDETISQQSDSRSPSQLGKEQERLFSAFEQNLKKTLMSFQGLNKPGSKPEGNDSDDDDDYGDGEQEAHDEECDADDSDVKFSKDRYAGHTRLIQSSSKPAAKDISDVDDSADEEPVTAPTFPMTAGFSKIGGKAMVGEDFFRAKPVNGPLIGGRGGGSAAVMIPKDGGQDSQGEESEEEKELMSKYNRLVGVSSQDHPSANTKGAPSKADLRIEFGKKSHLFDQKKQNIGDSLDDDDELDESDGKLDSENMRRINQRLERLKDIPDNSDADDDDEAPTDQPKYSLKPNMAATDFRASLEKQKVSQKIVETGHNDNTNSDEEELEVDNDKAKLLKWKNDLEERFKKLDKMRLSSGVDDNQQTKSGKSSQQISQLQPSHHMISPTSGPDILLNFSASKFNSLPINHSLANSVSKADHPAPMSSSFNQHKESTNLQAYASPAQPIFFNGSVRDQQQAQNVTGDQGSSRGSSSIKVKEELLANRDSRGGRNSLTQSPGAPVAYPSGNIASANPTTGHSISKSFGTGHLQKVSTHEGSSQAASGLMDDLREQRSGEELATLKTRVKELEDELARSKKDHETSLRLAMENQKKQLDSNKTQYQRELDHMKEQLEEAYTQNKEYEQLIQSLRSEISMISKSGSKRNLQGNVGAVKVACTQTVPLSEANNQMEKNFLKLKELYDTVYKANTALMRDQKELKEKYSKLLKEKIPRSSSKSLKTKQTEYESIKKPPIKMREDSKGKLSSASQRTRSRDTQQQNSHGSNGNTATKNAKASPATVTRRPPISGGFHEARPQLKKGRLGIMKVELNWTGSMTMMIMIARVTKQRTERLMVQRVIC
jgi:hypothetical protein